MASKADITSIEALEAFRANLVIFLKKARQAVDEVCDEVRRTRYWVQTDQRSYWQREERRRRKVLDQAEQELMSARISGLRDSTPVQQAAVRKARHALEEAEAKVRSVKMWNLRYDQLADPLAKRIEGIRQQLDDEMPKAIAYLTQARKTLEAYAETQAPSNAPQPIQGEETFSQPPVSGTVLPTAEQPPATT